MSNDYTPTTEQIKDLCLLGAIYAADGEHNLDRPGTVAMINRWLAAHDAESERKITEYAAVIKEIRKAWFGPCKFDEQDEEKISEILNRIAVTPD